MQAGRATSSCNTDVKCCIDGDHIGQVSRSLKLDQIDILAANALNFIGYSDYVRIYDRVVCNFLPERPIL